MDRPMENRRVKKTKKILLDTLIECMHEQPIGKISVKEITARADLNRGTFYLHYQDIYSLLNENKDELLNEIRRIITKSEYASIMLCMSKNEPCPVIVEIFEFFKLNKDFCRVLLGLHGNNSFLFELAAVLKNVFRNQHRTADNVFDEYLHEYIIFGFLGVMKQWFNADTAISSEKMAMMFAKMSIQSTDPEFSFVDTI